MGLFKKNKEKDEIDILLEKNKMKKNEAVVPGKEKRKDMKAMAENTRQSNIKKEQLEEQLKQLRKKMYTLPNCERETDKLDNIIRQLRDSGDNSNQKAMQVVDSFILKTVEEAFNHCLRGNLNALGSAIYDIDELVSDRQSASACFTNPKYIEFKLEKNRLNFEQQRQESALRKMSERLAELGADYNDPTKVHSRESIARKAKSLKDEAQRTKALLDKIEARISVIDRSMGVIEEESINKGENNFDLSGKMDDVLETKRENEFEESSIDKYSEKLNESHRNISSSALNVNDETESSSNTTTLSDDFFKI